VLRVAVAAARNDARIERSTLDRLTASAPIPTPWGEEARRLFVELFLAGRPAVGVVETLDQKGLWEPIMPEWGHIHIAGFLLSLLFSRMAFIIATAAGTTAPCMPVARSG